MKFNIQKNGVQTQTLARKIGYIPQKSTDRGETAFVRPISADFPRFHLYVKESADLFSFNLHLDQKKPSYGEHTAHSGEYEGGLVESEASRIQLILSKPNKEPGKEQPKEQIKSDEGSKLTNLFRKMFGN